MSELRTYDVIMTPSSDGSWVLKSEADKVIAEKDKEIARLEAIRKVHVEAIASMEAGLHQDEKEIRRLRRALWKLKALYFFRMFQWSMEGKRLALEDDEPEDFFMECMGKYTKRKSEWGKEADMFYDARIVCIKKAEEYK